MKIKVEVKKDIEVVFLDEKKALEYFTSAEFREGFWDHDDLEGVAKSIAASYVESDRDLIAKKDGEKHWGKEMEGYGTFFSTFDCTEYTTEGFDNECHGGIRIEDTWAFETEIVE